MASWHFFSLAGVKLPRPRLFLRNFITIIPNFRQYRNILRVKKGMF